MESLSTIFNTLLLKKESISTIIQSEVYSRWAAIFTLLVGVCHGIISYFQMPSAYIEFDSPVLQSIAFLIVILIGIFMVFITRVGLTFLLWAGGKAFGGPGLLRVLNRLTSFAIVPIIIGLPAITSINAGNSGNVLLNSLLFIALIWIYFISVKIIEVSQNLNKWKAYSAALFAFIFFASVYYIIIPPAS
ncbi:YIP1 family protein [Pseudalkalibacillus berkeleyi]|uniref:Yip1 domain-containing protein n=1 Tax=Pseudalkalibacillus berkeleyi TaxID=1069813 RepID=A0ABS9H4T1_9BACL|nr:YIP1 family protein [Pseudalkalibacillus berkeleyi]MCF6139076.1 hypothetical protein [Pseudalkalibacillus berkeleyi]